MRLAFSKYSVYLFIRDHYYCYAINRYHILRVIRLIIKTKVNRNDISRLKY